MFAVESRLPAFTTVPGFAAPADFGEISAATLALGTPAAPQGASVQLVSYLTQPLLIGRRQDYVLVTADDLPATAAGGVIWEFATASYSALSGNATNPFYANQRVNSPAVYKIWPGNPLVPGPGDTRTVRVHVPKTTALASFARIDLRQSVVSAPANLVALIQRFTPRDDDSARQALEIGFELKPYVDRAASAAGLPPRLLAAILLREIGNRFRHGTPAADAVIKAAEGRTDVFEDAVKRRIGWTNDSLVWHLDSIREFELDFVGRRIFRSVAEDLTGRALFRNVGFTKSYGVGQMQMPWAAVALGLIPDPTAPGTSAFAAAEAIETSFFATLTDSQIVDLFNVLRFPKSNILATALLLKSLVRRADRFPTATAADLLTSVDRAAVIAYEYNNGYTGRPLADLSVDIGSPPLANAKTSAAMVAKWVTEQNHSLQSAVLHAAYP